MEVLLKDKGFFKNVLRVFILSKEITIQITAAYISVSSYGLNKLYLIMESALFESEVEDFTFTVNTSHLLESLDTLEGDLIVGDGVSLVKGRSVMKIPFARTTNSEYEETDLPSTKFIVTADTVSVFSKLKGLVTYEIEDNKLFVRRNSENVVEEVEFIDIDFIMIGELKFKCNNSWTEVVSDIKGYVESVMVAFSENFLCVQFLFSRYSKSYLEFQIPRSLVG